MKRLLLILILTFSFQSWIKADDIRDFEIEGISIGDSLLLYSSKKEIDNNSIADYNSNKYSRYTLRKIKSKSLKKYDDVQVHFLTNDNKYIIAGVSGAIFEKDEFNQCLEMKDQVVNVISDMFPNTKINDVGESVWLEADPSGKTKTSQYFFNLESTSKYSDYIEVACYDWGEAASKKYNASDHFKLALVEKDFGKWLLEEAWN
jgi:hypothetical protein